jgi:hypothetical protein
MDMTDRQPSPIGKSHLITHRCCFAALAALEWLCDFSSVVVVKKLWRWQHSLFVSASLPLSATSARTMIPPSSSPSVVQRLVEILLLAYVRSFCHSGLNFMTLSLPSFSLASG